MPKQKTHKGLAKRVKVTASGKVKRGRAGAGHLMSHKSSKQRRNIGSNALIHKSVAALAREVLGK